MKNMYKLNKTLVVVAQNMDESYFDEHIIIEKI